MLNVPTMSSRSFRSLVICCVSALLGGGACFGEGPDQQNNSLMIELKPVALESGAATSTDGEAVRFVAGFELRSEGPEFGGFSGLECVGEDRLIAVSDRGHWLTARLDFDGTGRLRSLLEGRMGPLLDDDGQPVSGRGRRDAEELAALPGGDYLVTFEGEHRGARYGATEGGALMGSPRLLATPTGIFAGDDNAGFEAVTQLADGRLLLLTEGLRDTEGRLMGWLSESAVETAAEPSTAASTVATGYVPLRLEADGPFQPTAADTVPAGGPMAGDVLLLQRHHTPLTGVRIRLFRLPSSGLRTGAVLRPEELIRFEAPRTVDNFEGLTVCPRAGGGASIFIISDDNFSALQRTLLFQLEIIPPGA